MTRPPRAPDHAARIGGAILADPHDDRAALHGASQALGIGGPNLAASSLVMGTTVDLSVSGASANAPGWVIMALGGEVPVSSGGVTVYPDLNVFPSWVFLPFNTDTTGSHVLPVNVPYLHAAAGVVFTLQGYIPHPAGLSSALTNGLRMTIGY